MATIINNPTPERAVLVEGSDSGAGWAVAIIILLAVIGIGAYAWVRYHPGSAAAPSGGTNINVQLPAVPAQGGTPAAQ